MNVQVRKQTEIESLSIMVKGNTFFDSFTIDGSSGEEMGLETIPYLVDAAGVCICLRGRADIIIDTRSYRLAEGDMCVVMPNSILQVKSKSDDFRGYAAAVTQDFFYGVNMPGSTALYLQIKDDPCISLDRDEMEDLVTLWGKLKERDARTDHPFRYEISQLSVMTILYEIAAIYRKGQPLRQQPYSRKNKLFLEFQQLIALHHDRRRDIEFYADKLCITPRYLSVVAKEVSGATASESIERVVILNARLLLTTSELTIQQISDRLNFPNHSFFSKYFKRLTGMTPKECRTAGR